ncbi:flagellar hook-basal body complex protein FliE [bacterium]|nr:flagellar hook-basal body complex protein FliE [bacterium]
MTITNISSNPFASHLSELNRMGKEAQDILQPNNTGSVNSFSNTLNNALQQVNNLQQVADHKITEVTTGQSQDTLGAIVALQRADLSMQLLAQVRNKALKAYEEIMRMPV